MRTILVIGYDGPGSSAKPTPVYCGYDRSEADAVMAADTVSVRFEITKIDRAIRKENTRHPSIAAAAAAENERNAAAAAAADARVAAAAAAADAERLAEARRIVSEADAAPAAAPEPAASRPASKSKR